MLLNVVVLQVLRWWAHSVEVECLWNQWAHSVDVECLRNQWAHHDEPMY